MESEMNSLCIQNIILDKFCYRIVDKHSFIFNRFKYQTQNPLFESVPLTPCPFHPYELMKKRNFFLKNKQNSIKVTINIVIP